MPRTSRLLALVALVALIVGGGAAKAPAQYPFGKNKVHYAPRDWKVIETAHCEIYYYPDEAPIAEYVASASESVYAEYALFFAVEFDRRIPIILYGTHHDFKETNVVPYLISESTGGFTEFIKGRIAIPFLGSYPQLLKVFRHELVHAFMLEKLRVVMSGHRRFTYEEPPLWFSEGLAEYLANRAQDTEAHMFVRDAVTSGIFLPLHELWRIQGTYLMYKEGESALHYIATSYGRDAIRCILESWWKADRWDLVLKASIGVTGIKLNDGWELFLKRRYYPAILDRRAPGETAELLSKEERSFQLTPVSAVVGGVERFFCVGYNLGSFDILELTRNDRGTWDASTFIRAGRTARFESIPLLRSRISARGDTLAFVAKAGERDAIYLYDISERRILRSITYEGARILASPAIAPDGGSVAFSAIDGEGRSDLFLCDIGTGSFRRLTTDFFDDLAPDWHPRGGRLVFSSDRCSRGAAGEYALYELDLASLAVTPLTDGGHRDSDPRWLADGSGVLFSSDRGGSSDIYLASGNRISRQTSLLGGGFTPFPSTDGSSFLLAVYGGGTFRAYRAPLAPSRPSAPIPAALCAAQPWHLPTTDSLQAFTRRDYRLRFGVDLIGAAFAVDPDFGSLGNGAQIFLTDILGNHELIFLVGSASENFDDFFSRLNLAFTYVNLEHRLNYALGAFHLASYTGSSFENIRYERRYGGVVGVTYPLSTFTRVELSTVVKGMERDDDITTLGLLHGRSWLLSNFVSATFDNIVWYIGGPLTGSRMNVSVGNTIDLQGSRYESTTLQADFRNYASITPRIVFAQRLVSRNAWGSDLQLFYIGGAWDVRGYRFREFAGKRIFYANTELRFPLLDRLIVGLPFGAIEFPPFRGSLFFDAGHVEGFIDEARWIGSLGVGVEMNLGYLPVARLNFSRTTDFKEIPPEIEIDFFLGFNF